MGRCFTLICLLFIPTAVMAQLEVIVEPSNNEVRDNIQAFIGPVEAESRREMWRLARHATDQATKAAQALGYYHTRIRPDVTGSRDAPVLELNVSLGQPVLLDKVDIRVEGQGRDTFQLPSSSKLRQGAVLNHGHYENYKTLISNQALRYGYFGGRFEQQELLVDVEDYQANITLVYQSGDRFRLGEVAFSDTPFNENLLQRMVRFRTGVPYDADLLAELNRDLLSSGYFETVQVSASANMAEDGLIPVNVEIRERDQHSLGFGGGFSTDVGPRAKVNWTQHWINPQGHSRGADLEVSAPRQQISTWYQIPLDPPQSNSLRFFTGFQDEEIDDVETRSFTVGAQLLRTLDSGWERVIGLRLEQEQFSLGNESGQSTLLIPSLLLQRTVSDNAIDPSKGYRLTLDLQGAKEGVLADFDFVRVNASAKGLYTLLEKHRLLSRASIGAIGSESFDSLPPSLRFFAGGDQSVRGYDFRTLAPTDESGEHIGGRYLVATSLEYQYEFIDKWRGAVFVDHGNAMDSLTDPRETSLGLGVRWVSPVGPIRVDVARSITEPDEGFRLHFSMGPEL
ncbi:autotransporter assembly complex protein TamA [Halopseudomonas sp.]|jgi:translocation and assembly module TamA|uniref:autotransporter assembly complex protein TamA n=1 Tax=Halopseudomonas sp. TaxID=2901191 RepID=UPI0039E2CB24